MFLMCSTGSRTLTGLQRPWRVLPPVFIFSLAMGGLCTYSSSVTHYGLNELCIKLGEITGSSTCTYTVNVATLAYERRIRGVYQAIRLTILTAWLHTICWLLSALLTLARVALAVDFQLVRINVDLVGDIDKMLEHHETQIRTVSPEVWINDERDSETSMAMHPTGRVQFKHKISTQTEPTLEEDVEILFENKTDVLYISKFSEVHSEHSLVPEESQKIDQKAAYEKVPEDKHFIVKMVYDLVQNIILADTNTSSTLTSTSGTSLERESEVLAIVRQKGQEKISLRSSSAQVSGAETPFNLADPIEAEKTAQEIRRFLQEKLDEQLRELPIPPSSSRPTSAHKKLSPLYESTLNITEEMKDIIEAKKQSIGVGRSASSESDDDASKVAKKSNLKNVSVQTDKSKKRTASQKVQITEPQNVDESTETVQDSEKETQTSKKKEKQD
ncbi:uncharacterized protein LOC135080387 [Ostrinia nubilalis]|uniref:uncharacterized protein LOC135080387 n=1 Tax=Ostrinia nubilalis TaxID=29057 RepID=UPI003082599C